MISGMTKYYSQTAYHVFKENYLLVVFSKVVLLRVEPHRWQHQWLSKTVGCFYF
jgi:hypothetical protein